MQTVTLDEKEFAVFQLLDLIQRMQRSIDFHLASDSPDALAIEQYTEQRERYRIELADLLRPYGFRLDVLNVA